jgi:non-ribosomal peptide synthetase component F
VPFERVVEELQPARSLSHNPLCQVLFTLQNAQEHAVTLPGLEVEFVGGSTSVVRFDLHLYGKEEEDRIDLAFLYSTDLFDDATLERWATQFITLLTDVVADPEQRLSVWPILPAEGTPVLPGGNATVGEEQLGRAPTSAVPESALEVQLAAIWQATLGVTQICRDDNFFELGGHSLLAMQVIFRLRQALGIEVPLRAILDSTTLADLAESIGKLQATPSQAEITRAPREAYRLTASNSPT